MELSATRKAPHRCKYLFGKFELAQNGTILLDEIGEMALYFNKTFTRSSEQEVDQSEASGLFRSSSRYPQITKTFGSSSRGQFREDLLPSMLCRCAFRVARSQRRHCLTEYFAKYGAAEAAVDAETIELLGAIRLARNVGA
jgi:hypothetical protein